MQEVIQSKETEVKRKKKSKVNMAPSWPDNWQISKWTQIWLEGAPWQIGEYHKKQSYDKSRQHIKRQRCHFADKGPHSQSYGFSSSHVQMWVLDHKKKGLNAKELMFLICAGEDSWESLGQQGDQASQS